MKTAKNKGFTLIELMIAVVLLAILLSVGVPSFSTLLQNNRLLSENYALRSLLSVARSEAQTQRTTVTVCRSTNGSACSVGDWNVGYVAFIDNDLDGNLEAADGDRLLQMQFGGSPGVSLSYSQASDILLFDSRGNALGSNGTFTFCDDRGAPEARGIIVSSVGTVQAAINTAGGDDAAVRDDHAGSDLSCGS